MAAHWYDTEGNLIETFTTKKGHESPITLRQAKPKGLLPSVTTIIKATLVNFGLQRYWENQVLEAAYTEPRREDDTDKEWKKRVKASAAEHSKEAAEEGRALHDELRDWIKHWDPRRKALTLSTGNWDPALKPVCDWLEANLDLRAPFTEKAWVSPGLQYAGTVDLLVPSKDASSIYLVDFKSQNDKLRVYDDFPIQLAGYAAMVGPSREMKPSVTYGQPLRRVSVVFSRVDPSISILAKEYSDEETARHDRIWNRCLQNWRDIQEYWPGEPMPGGGRRMKSRHKKFYIDMKNPAELEMGDQNKQEEIPTGEIDPAADKESPITATEVLHRRTAAYWRALKEAAEIHITPDIDEILADDQRGITRVP